MTHTNYIFFNTPIERKSQESQEAESTVFNHSKINQLETQDIIKQGKAIVTEQA